jgi:DNA-binding FrmR family transcriptional regulator
MSHGIRHAAHADVVKRLKRVSGHLTATIGMIESGRPCLDLAQQLRAVERGLAEAKRVLIETHIDHCLDQAVSEGKAEAALAEVRELTKYL